MHDRTKTSLALHDNVRDTHLAAQGGQEDDEFDGVNVVGDHNERCLLRLDKGNTVVETIFDKQGLLGVFGLSLLLLGSCLSSRLETGLLLLLGLRTIPSEHAR